MYLVESFVSDFASPNDVIICNSGLTFITNLLVSGGGWNSWILVTSWLRNDSTLATFPDCTAEIRTLDFGTVCVGLWVWGVWVDVCGCAFT